MRPWPDRAGPVHVRLPEQAPPELQPAHGARPAGLDDHVPADSGERLGRHRLHGVPSQLDQLRCKNDGVVPRLPHGTGVPHPRRAPLRPVRRLGQLRRRARGRRLHRGRPVLHRQPPGQQCVHRLRRGLAQVRSHGGLRLQGDDHGRLGQGQRHLHPIGLGHQLGHQVVRHVPARRDLVLDPGRAVLLHHRQRGRHARWYGPDRRLRQLCGRGDPHESHHRHDVHQRLQSGWSARPPAHNHVHALGLCRERVRHPDLRGVAARRGQQRHVVRVRVLRRRLWRPQRCLQRPRPPRVRLRNHG